MAQYSAETAHNEPAVSGVADPIPLGLSAFAFTTAILGCTFAGFILPGVGAGISLVVAAEQYEENCTSANICHDDTCCPLYQ